MNQSRLAVAIAFVVMSTATSRAEPSAMPVTRAAIERAAAYSTATGGRALIILRDGGRLLERYSNGHSPGERWKIFSGTKTFWTAAALAARAEGLLDLDEPVVATITEWAGTGKARITIRQLLDCSSGLDPGFRLHRRGIPDRNRIALALPLVSSPGRSFIYGPSHGQVFLEVLARKLRPRGLTPRAYLNQKILAPLGLQDIPLRTDDEGMPLWATGFELTAREWASFGQALLRDSPRLLPPGALQTALAPSRANRAFGLCFWLNSAARHPLARVVDVEEELEPDWRKQNWRSAALSKTAPPDLFAAIGSYGQRLYLVPSARLVVVRLGQGRQFRDAPFLDHLFSHSGAR